MLRLDKETNIKENLMSRKYTNELLEMIENGLLDKDTVIMACVKYMSEDDVKDMMELMILSKKNQKKMRNNT